jgi:phospholipid/cholesterol/gamma-HCH transport system ATP-binding protein
MIRMINCFRAFGANRVLRGVSLDVRDGETLTIIGGSGTGKSVTLKLMVGLMKPDRGEIFVDDREITRLNEQQLADVQRQFAYVFQGGALFDSLTVGQNVAFGLYNLENVDKTKIGTRVKECLGLVGLAGIENLKPAELSGGMRKRVAVARAVAMQPKYLLYDEPSTGLDPIMSDVINDMILGIQKKLGTTAVVVTHDMKSAFKISNRIAMLYEGKIVEIDTPENFGKSKNPLIHQFVTGSAEGPIKMKVRAF